jgi:hypothetical protein
MFKTGMNLVRLRMKKCLPSVPIAKTREREGRGCENIRRRSQKEGSCSRKGMKEK